MSAGATAVEIHGRTLTFPVEVRAASSWAAQFTVPADAAQAIVDPTGLEVAQVRPGRAVCSIVFVRYTDGDLDAYEEVGIAYVVRPHDARRANALAKSAELARGAVCVYIHQLPVNQAFTLEAGRSIWGYPKFMADIQIDALAARTTCALRHDGSLVLAITVRDGGHIPLPSRTFPTYTHLGGVLRRTEWEMPDTRVRARLGGASLVLGEHPIAEELRALGLPKRALMTQTIPRMRARFGPAEVVTS